jgi:putative Ca2+/H+ antiporter (TMEM165/GDT1 family)
MSLKIFMAAFWTIFLAELGDKTQFVNFSLAAKSNAKVSIMLGSIAAFSIITIITVYLGSIAGKFVKPEYIRYASGALFVALGILILFDKL